MEFTRFSKDVEVPQPSNRGAKEFEADVLRYGESNRYPILIKRNGVMASMFKGKTMVMKSFPDFEGTLNWDGKVIPFVCDAKVCRTGVMNHFTRKGESSYHQVRYMMRKAAFGEVCGFLVYFPERVLKTRVDEPGTFWIPVHPASEFWMGVQAGGPTTISRARALEIGHLVPWVSRGGTAKIVPDLVPALLQAANQWFGVFDPVVRKKGWKTNNEEEESENESDTVAHGDGAEPGVEVHCASPAEAGELEDGDV